MRYYEFPIYINETKVNIFVKGTLSTGNPASSTLHKHHYAEIHLIEKGKQQYLVGDHHIILKSGDALVIPGNTFHKGYPPDEDVKMIAFQIDYPFPSYSITLSTPGIFTELLEKIRHAEQTDNYSQISAYLTQICSNLLNSQNLHSTPVQNRNFIIHEFFSDNYNRDITLADLAAELNLSPRQAERVLIESIGSTFRKELTRKRIEAAKHLFSTENISLEEIALQVGYHSYSGFWRAYKKGTSAP